MGGKQKRAAKYKKWMEAQQNLKQSKESSTLNGDISSDGMYYDGSGDHLTDHQPVPYHVQQEILRCRAKKTKKQKNNNWISRKMGQLAFSFESFPTWPITVVVTLVSFIFVFFLIRTLIQLFAPPDVTSVDRSALYSSIRMAVPGQLYTFIRVLDYLFSSPDLSFGGISNIIYPPEEHSRYNQQYQQMYKARRS